MSGTISLMVTPTGSSEALPQILLEQSGLWRDMSPSLDMRLAVKSQTIRDSMDALLGELMAQMEHSVHPSLAVLRAAFKQHYKMIVPAGVQQTLSAALTEAAPGETPLLRLHIHPAAEWIPWELLHDGINFLGLNFQIARLPILSNSPDLSAACPHPVRQVYSFLGKNVFDDQQAAQLNESWQQTFKDLLPGNVSLSRQPVDNSLNAVFPNVENLIQASKSGDILHITCHGNLQDKFDKYYWTLDHESPLTFDYKINPAIVSDLSMSNTPLVFGNACASSNSPAGAAGLSPGFGSQFFAQGAISFIGTYAPITQTLAVRFARKFFELLLTPGGAPAAVGQTAPGMAVGRALLETKRFFAAEGQPDPSYLYYCLYGPAEICFCFEQ